MMNGALTIGTLDGANVEMHEVLGDENMFLFGLKAHEVAQLKREGWSSQRTVAQNADLARVLDSLKRGYGDGVAYDDLVQRLLANDEYLLLEDFASYCEAQNRVTALYADKEGWNRKSLIGIARSGIFAADRAVGEYADNIWHVDHR